MKDGTNIGINPDGGGGKAGFRAISQSATLSSNHLYAYIPLFDSNYFSVEKLSNKIIFLSMSSPRSRSYTQKYLPPSLCQQSQHLTSVMFQRNSVFPFHTLLSFFFFFHLSHLPNPFESIFLSSSFSICCASISFCIFSSFFLLFFSFFLSYPYASFLFFVSSSRFFISHISHLHLPFMCVTIYLLKCTSIKHPPCIHPLFSPPSSHVRHCGLALMHIPPTLSTHPSFILSTFIQCASLLTCSNSHLSNTLHASILYSYHLPPMWVTVDLI